MKNLAGVADADLYIREELILAGIAIADKKSDGEVPYSIIGKLGDWTFKRAWHYWIANSKKRLPIRVASKLYEKKYPAVKDSYEIYGQAVRVGGHAGCLHPREYPVTNSYHIDTQLGLNEFAHTIESLKKD